MIAKNNRRGANAVERYLKEKGWQVVHRESRPGRTRQLFGVDGLNLGRQAAVYVQSKFPDGLYRHQIHALESLFTGQHTCLATGTASGKSAVFYCAALDLLQRQPGSKILAMYPMKALAREQEDRWKAAFAAACLPTSMVQRIDGDVPAASRAKLLREASVILATPDVCHAWLLPSLRQSHVWSFISSLCLVIVDEVHVYTGVFGSNSAFLFRRLQHAMTIAGKSAVYLAASATIRDPNGHLRMLFGKEFTVIGPDADTSPQYPLEVSMVEPPEARDLLTAVSDFAKYLASASSGRFIVFVDSRKQTELISSIVARERASGTEQEEDPIGAADEDSESGEEDGGSEDTVEPDAGGLPGSDHLQTLNVLPFRAGYEVHDRETIQRRLTDGSLRGVVSTSALELGIDIPDLSLAVLVGVPRSMTSLTQRIGRVGRQRPGKVIIVNDRSAYSESVFMEPQTLFQRPLGEGALYLENPRVQYIHAMCLSREGGEHEAACEAAHKRPEDCLLQEGVSWPQGFIDLCEKERTGQIPRDLQSMKSDAGESPHHTFPLRDVESQFEVQVRSRRDIQRCGSLSYGQVLREAYPGAVYYYTTTPYRVTFVNQKSRQVLARPERRYTTKPKLLPTMVFPNFSEDVFAAKRFGDAALVECHLQVREAVNGVTERRGPNEFTMPYPLERAGLKFRLDRFVRNYFSTGVLLCHPALAAPGVDRQALADAAYECFLIQIPFERQDISAAIGTIRAQWGHLAEGTPFIVFYDQVYGSLRLSGRLMDREVMVRVLEKVTELGSQDGLLHLNQATIQCAEAIFHDLANGVESTIAVGADDVPVPDTDRYTRVLNRGGRGVDLTRGNEDFVVEDVFFSPTGLRYRGRHPSDTDPTVTVTMPVTAIVPTPGEPMALYDAETGQLIPISTHN
jgi:DEAD/DEAH box helicase domain-containing protein